MTIEQKTPSKAQIELADKIAARLLTVHDGPECTRMQLMLKKGHQDEVNMGGRCKSSMVAVILEVLQED